MFIKEVEIRGFGNLVRRKFRFNPGLNVVYGPNGSGKSTLLAFVQGIWFGFVKAGQRRLRQDPRWKSFAPHHSPEFGGRMTVGLDQGAVTIVADLKERQVMAFDELTGREITADFVGEDGYLRLGEQLTQMEQSQFEMLCFLGQNDPFEESALAEAFQGLSPLTMVTSMTLRLEEAIRWLDSENADLGTPRAYKKPRGALERERARLEDELRAWKDRGRKLEESKPPEALEEKSAETTSQRGRLLIIGGILILLAWGAYRLGFSWPVPAILAVVTMALWAVLRRRPRQLTDDTKEAYREQGRQELKAQVDEEVKAHIETLHMALQHNREACRRMDEKIEHNKKAVELLTAMRDREVDGIKPRWLRAIGAVYGELYRRPVQSIYTTKNGFQVLFQDGSMCDSGEMSQGERKLFALAYRFALCQVLEGDESLPWLLDEPFAHLDDYHSQNLSRYLEKESQTRQIVVFSCQARDVELLDFGTCMAMVEVNA